VDEAIILGLTRLVATRDEVDIEVLHEGSRGFLGLGMREASVRLTRRPDVVEEEVTLPPEPAPAAVISESVPAVVTTAPAPETPVVEEEVVSVQVESPVSAPMAETKPLPVEKTEKAPRHPRRERTSEGLDRGLVEKTASDVAQNLFAGLSIQFSMSWEQEDRPTLWISLKGRDADTLVGPRAQTLNAVQYLFRSLLHRLADGNYNVVVDADGYRKRRQRSLESLARKLANQAVNSGRSIKMRPMPAHERRVVHILLRKDKRVKTESAGRGRDRAITIVPNKRKR
jgi:spoIIIJ-associated protein